MWKLWWEHIVLSRNRVKWCGNAPLAKQSGVVRSHHVTAFGALEAQGTLQGKTLWKINQFLINIFSSEESLHNMSMCGGLYHHQAQPLPPKIVGWRMIMCRIWKVPSLPSPVAQNWVKHLGYIQQNIPESSSLVSDSFCFLKCLVRLDFCLIFPD